MSKAEQYVQKLKECQQMDTEEGHCGQTESSWTSSETSSEKSTNK